MSKEKAKICVTGASGYLASWVVKHLLDEGHTVHGTVRDTSRADKVAHLTKLAAASKGELRLFEADLLAEGSFADAIAGTDYVIHTASPFMIGKVQDPMKELVEPAVNGVENVLTEVNKHESVKRVVLTSSVVSIWTDGIEAQRLPNKTFTEEHWNETATVDYMPYNYSKTQAERAAWKIAEAQTRWDLVVVNPGFVLGPSLSSRMDGVSMNFMKIMTDGTMGAGAPKFYSALVDVRDVAMAHLLAAFTPEAEGRHIAAIDQTHTFTEMGLALREEFGNQYKFPKGYLPKWLAWTIGPAFGLNRKNVSRSANMPYKVDNSKSKEKLGLSYRSMKETLVDQMNQMLDAGLIPKK